MRNIPSHPDENVFPLSPEARLSLAEKVARELRQRIYDMRYLPGSVLRQEKLSEELGVSRTPLREAMKMLVQDGLLVNVPGRGARVVTGDLTTLLAAYELRAVVDGLAARLAVRSIRKKDLTSLASALEAQRRVLDPWNPDAYTKTNVQFHEQIMQIGGNEFVIAQIHLLRMTAQVFAPVAVIGPDSARNAVAQHHDIVDALSSGDEDLAEQVARKHIQTTIDRLQELQQHRDVPEKEERTI